MFHKISYKKIHAVVIISLVLLYFITRLYNLLLLPIFTDESIYIFWAKTIATTKSQWFISLSDGKPPILVWMIGILLSIFPSDMYLLAGRLPSVGAGLFSLVGIYFLSRILFSSHKAGLIASFLYIISPFTLLYDRMALFDSLLSAMLIWSCFFAIKTAHTLKIQDAVFWGFFLGLAFLSKPTALVFLLLTPIIFLLFIPFASYKKEWKRMLLLIAVALGIGYGINNLQRISSTYPAMVAKNKQFQVPLRELLAEPFKYTQNNMRSFFTWIVPYYTLSFFMVGVCSFFYLLIKKIKIASAVFLLWFVPLFALATVGRELFPRYILIVTPYFFLPVAYACAQILKQSKFVTVLLLGIVVLSLYSAILFDYLILTNPPAAPIPLIDYQQYIAHHPSGYGLDAIFTRIDKESQNHPIVVVTQGTFGLYPYAFNLRYWDNKNVIIVPKWPLDKVDKEIEELKFQGPVYIVFKDLDRLPPTFPVELVITSVKPGGKNPIFFTQLK